MSHSADCRSQSIPDLAALAMVRQAPAPDGSLDTIQMVLEGQFLSFVMKSGKVKYLRMGIADDEVQLKLSKQARASLFHLHEGDRSLQPSDIIHIDVKQTRDRHSGDLKFKVCAITRPQPTGDRPIPGTTPAPSRSEPRQSPKVKLLTCQKSGCQKKGSRKQVQRLEQVLRDRQLHHLVEIQTTGCLGKCSMAPNIVLLPGKKRLSGMDAEAIADLLEQLHLSSRKSHP